LADRKQARHSELREAINNTSFKVSVLVMVVLVLGAAVSFMLPALRTGELFQHGYRYTVLLEVLSGAVLLFAAPILCTFPYTTAFLGERESGEIRFFLPRTTKWRYTLKKIQSVAVSGGLVLVLGILVSLLILFFAVGAREMPKEVYEPTSYDVMYGYQEPVDVAITSGVRILTVTLRFFLFGAFWSLIGAFCATAFRSRFLAYAAPFVFYYLLIILSERYLKDVFLLDPRKWVLGEGHWPGGDWGILLFFAEIIVLACMLFGFSIWRRLSDE